jgi:2-succinyl-6-hydroxy-2,4-cyclohexadiene-1-carboxylate synthase
MSCWQRAETSPRTRPDELLATGGNLAKATGATPNDGDLRSAPVPPARRLVAVHGFAQTGRCWGPLPGDLVRAGFDVVAPDLPGHGPAPVPPLDLPATAAAVADIGGRATYLGYSFGGRVCLRLALDRPDLVERLVLVSATAGLDDPAERASRVAADERLAAGIEEDGVAAFLDRWLRLPLFAGLPEQHQYRAERLGNRPDGLAGSLRLAGTGAQEPLWAALHRLRMPVLVVTGALDGKFVALGNRLTASIGSNAIHVVADGAGHTVHLERPEAFLDVLTRWLEQTSTDAV